MTLSRFSIAAILLAVGALALGCSADTESASDSGSSSEAPAPTDTLTLNTKADSVAHRLMTAHGAEAWASAPYLRFAFVFETPDQSRVIGRHFWDRTSGDYRVEWTTGPDSNYVAIVNVRDVDGGTPEGEVYLNGQQLDGTAAQTGRQDAYGRFINDTYWLLAPLKVFDPGVNREYVADSSTADHDVLHLTFGDVGMTPGDEYWLYVSTDTGQLDRWAYHLEDMPDDAAPRSYDWTGYTSFQAPSGTVTLSERKEAVGSDRALLTTELALPSTPPENVFSAPTPILGPDTD